MAENHYLSKNKAIDSRLEYLQTEVYRKNKISMEILLQIEKYDDSVNNNGLSTKEKEEIKNLILIDGDKDIKVVNIGPGADVLVILGIINLIVDIFLIGDKVINGIDGWIKLGKHINKFYDKKQLVAVDSDGASLLAINFISNYEDIYSFRKVNDTNVNLVDLTNLIMNDSSLASKPHNYYIQTYIINDEKYYIIGIKSNGEVNLIKCFEYGCPYGIFEEQIKLKNRDK